MTDTHLNEQQTEVLANYQSLTGEDNVERSIQVLRNNNWDLQVLFGRKGEEAKVITLLNSER